MSRLPRLTLWSFFVMMLSLAGSSGCGPSFGKVSGEVKFNNKPLPNGIIAFISSQKGARPAMGLIENGRYTVAQVPVGEVAITVNTPPKPPPDPKAKKKSKKDKK